MKTSFLLITSVAALAMVGAGCVRRAPTVTTNAPSPTVQTESIVTAFVKLNDGRANVTRDGQTVAAQDDAGLFAGDRVKVTNGTVSLIYPDAGETQLENGSDVTILSEDQPSKRLFAELQLTAGRAWTRFERLLGKDEQFSVIANGVVATVRGTAFGVAILGEDVDVQVAENTVEVSQEVANVSQAAETITVAAQEGVSVRGKKFVKRSLSDVERASEGFRFASRTIAPERLRRPVEPRQLFLTNPSVPSNFVAPARNVQPSGVIPSNVAPSVQGPTPSTRTQNESSGFVKLLKTIRSGDREFDGGLVIELQHKDGFQARNAMEVLRIGTLDVVSPCNFSETGETGPTLLCRLLTPAERAQLRSGDRIWVWYNSFDLEHYDFGRLDLGMLDR